MITAFLGIMIYFLLAYRAYHAYHNYLIYAALCLCLALGVKSTTLLFLPSVLIVAYFALKPER